uniref:Uncharacterized protein n=1 Tax=Lepeophtheirus salmonis TaxID=72036 RepID=A0A0K2U7D1_LEPSM
MGLSCPAVSTIQEIENSGKHDYMTVYPCIILTLIVTSDFNFYFLLL